MEDQQHSFKWRRSCESQLLITDDEVAKSLVLWDQVDIVLLDFSNFDKVTHHRLLHKLQYCIRGKIWNWVNFKDFLAKRTLQVTLQVQSSTRGHIQDPQGTMMGPVLFLYPWLARVYFIRCEIIRWWLPALSQNYNRKVNSISDAEQLQLNLKPLEKWKLEWQMNFTSRNVQSSLSPGNRDP